MNDMTTITHDGLTFRVTKEHDADVCAPWEWEDGHGPVRESGHGPRRPKRGGELRLGSWSLYDFAAACKIALRDGWNGCRNREEAAQAARADYDNMQAWCNDEWSYIGVVVTLLDVDGNETDAQQSIWGVHDAGTYADTLAQELAEDCAREIADRIDYTDSGTRYTRGARSWIISRETGEVT